ncbi:MAG: DUF3750 domain-containing protein [Pseudomonadota bacterium]
MKKLIKRLVLFVFIVFALPALVSFATWQANADRPSNWHTANWNTAGILPKASENPDPVVYVMAARTGRWKGAFSVHSWIVTKEANSKRYNRYDKVGWGSPIRVNNYAADANWYSNPPVILKTFHGKEAQLLIPKIEAAVKSYPHSRHGNYSIWPGPNSNSFIAHVLNEVPELDLVLPANAIGRDFISGGEYILIDPDWMNIQVNLDGYLGFAIGKRSGLELQFMGLVAGLDFSKPGIKLPGFGTISFL